MSEGTVVGAKVEESERPDPRPDWKWYVAHCPSIGWDMVFQARPDLRAPAGMADERLDIRRVSKLITDQEKKMHCIPWFPFYFTAIDKFSETTVARNLFLWISDTCPAAAEDWDKSWEKQSGLAIVSEGQGEIVARNLAEEARGKADMARKLRDGRMGVTQPQRR